MEVVAGPASASPAGRRGQQGKSSAKSEGDGQLAGAGGASSGGYGVGRANMESMDAVSVLSAAGKQGRNELVPRGLQGANTLQLRATENAYAVTCREAGTLEQRTQTLQKQCGLDKLGENAGCVIDDSWEDETGLVRCRAQYFKNRSRRHDPHVLPEGRGDAKYRPMLSLLYDTRGEPACLPPPVGASDKDFAEFQREYFEKCRDEETGQYKVGIADALGFAAVKEPAGWAADTPYPTFIARFSEGLMADKSSSAFELAPGSANNPKRAQEMTERMLRGGFKFLRVTNADSFQALPKNHSFITWAEILGQHCSSYFEPLEQLKPEPKPSSDSSALLSTAGCNASKASNESQGEEEAKAKANPDSERPVFEFSLLKELDRQDELDEELEYRCQLIRTRFSQFEEYLDRSPEHRQCVMCQGPGADCVFLPIGDYDIAGLEWDDPACFCMACRRCVTNNMLRRDLCNEIKHQRCRACWRNYGGYQVHNAATKKLMLMQAATEVMLFCGPRQDDEPEETFEENAVRRACIKTVVEVGFMRALGIEIGASRTTEFWMRDLEGHLQSEGWKAWGMPQNDRESTGYFSSAIDGRVLLRLAEAEAQLENFEAASTYAKRAGELLSTLDRGRIVNGVLKGGHPARQLIGPAMDIAKRLAEDVSKQKAALVDGDAVDKAGGAGKKKQAHKNSKGKKKKK